MTFISETDTTVSGTITTQNLVPAGVATDGSAVEIACNTKGACAIQVVGTWAGVLSLQGTIDGTNWVTIGMASAVKNIATDTYSASIPSASPGIYFAPCGAYVKLRVTALAATTGSAVITMNLTRASRSVTIDSGLPPGSAVLGNVNLTTSASQGGSLHSLVAAATTNATSVKAAPGTIYAHVISNKAITGMWFKFYNKASAPTVGTDVPVLQYLVPASTSISLNFGAAGLLFSNGIAFAITVLDAANDTTAVAAAQCYSTLVYK